MSELFPDIIVIRDQLLHSQGWLQAILNQLSREFLSMRPGTEIVVNRLNLQHRKFAFLREQEIRAIIDALSDYELSGTG